MAKPGASKHRTSIHNKYCKQRRQEQRLMRRQRDTGTKLAMSHKNKTKRTKCKQFREFVRLHNHTDFDEPPKTVLDYFGCGCFFCAGYDSGSEDPAIRTSPDQRIELIDNWCYIFDVFQHTALNVLSQLYEDPAISYQVRYRHDILRKLSTKKNRLKLVGKTEPNKYTYHTQQCSMWYPWIRDKLEEIEMAFSYQSPQITDLITEAAHCGTDIAMMITAYLEYMQEPPNSHRFAWMQDATDSTLWMFVDHVSQCASDSGIEACFKWTHEEEWSRLDYSHSAKFLFPIQEFYVYREWDYRDIHTVSKHFTDDGMFGVFVGRMDVNTRAIYFYLRVDNESAQLVLARDFSDLYVNGIESPFVKIECFEEL
eukprot:CAMPEP_0197037638 /NCGR_PEP_ID=MMETSP1384-20130603/14786_1 /TAXON_ID=29189 /ORGANISM="Ammonia sp." /LENGTH=367 /DNA_ID=CAMNT_0042467963 /DNA_START=41 /DNA_END=1141 /DNA_ORIENTATION=+